jgi:hypothetical protein
MNDSKYSEYYTTGGGGGQFRSGGLRDSIASSSRGGMPVMNQTMATKRTEDLINYGGGGVNTSYSASKKEDQLPVVKMLARPGMNSSMPSSGGIQLRMSKKVE